MLKNSKTGFLPAIAAPGIKKEIESARVSKSVYQSGTLAGNGYNMFDSPQEEINHRNISLLEVTFSYTTKGEEFHWMADAAYHQSK